MYDFALQMRVLRTKRKEMGVCIYCTGPLVTSTMCERCADKKRPGTNELIMREKMRYPLTRKRAERNR
ncbi:hypothetical protein [Cohnella soli]|uniref:Ribosome biogenesis protein n=1 Tax=Cohnella soli TaxID=425005 RepID=A0ABW0HM96_9BACL